MSTCALVGASDFNADHFRQMDEAGAFDYVIAVDGGLAHLEGIGRKPDLVMGDFDSLGYVPRGMRVTRFPSEKDASDMELALKRAKNRHTDVYVYGGLGRRLDHTLANLQLFAHFSELGLYVVAIDESTAVTFITGPDTLEIPAQESGATVSVFAMNDAATGVFERGLKWELDDFTLTNRTSLGLSNEFTGEAVMIGVEEGTLAVFVPLA
ncbi:MAG: thiamine diphosphokinase [Eggerthellaceae bacterium]|nr:thiamine diphosphokinase [Eggerthellaceae bacterium]